MANTVTLSAAQLKYAAAKAAFTVISGHADVTDDDYCAAFQAKIDAQGELLAWAQGVIASDPKTAARFGEVAHVFTQGIKFPAIREKLIDTCMRLAA